MDISKWGFQNRNLVYFCLLYTSPTLPLRVGPARSPCRLFEVQGLRADLYVLVHSHCAVSYTHLDVYKRQRLAELCTLSSFPLPASL